MKTGAGYLGHPPQQFKLSVYDCGQVVVRENRGGGGGGGGGLTLVGC